jgi:hypothetical protein
MSWFYQFWDWMVSNLEWSLFARFCVALIMAGALGAAFQKGFNLLQERRQQAWFFISVSLAFAVILWQLPNQHPKPSFRAEIPYAALLNASDDPSGPPSIIAEIMLINDGYAQSTVGYFTVSTEIDGHVYHAVPLTVPSIMTINSFGGFTIFCGKDSLFIRSMYPIQSGAAMPGVALFQFTEGTPSLFNRPLTLHLKWKDTFGGSYEAPIEIHGSGAGPTIEIPGVDVAIVKAAQPSNIATAPMTVLGQTAPKTGETTSLPPSPPSKLCGMPISPPAASLPSSAQPASPAGKSP